MAEPLIRFDNVRAGYGSAKGTQEDAAGQPEQSQDHQTASDPGKNDSQGRLMVVEGREQKHTDHFALFPLLEIARHITLIVYSSTAASALPGVSAPAARNGPPKGEPNKPIVLAPTAAHSRRRRIAGCVPAWRC